MNNISSLPEEVDHFLADLAQYGSNPEIDYNDIINFANANDTDSILSIKAHIADIAELDFDFEDDEVIISLDAIASLVKNTENS